MHKSWFSSILSPLFIILISASFYEKGKWELMEESCNLKDLQRLENSPWCNFSQREKLPRGRKKKADPMKEGSILRARAGHPRLVCLLRRRILPAAASPFSKALEGEKLPRQMGTKTQEQPWKGGLSLSAGSSCWVCAPSGCPAKASQALLFCGETFPWTCISSPSTASH